MELTAAQKQTLYDQGFVNFPGIIPRELVDRALRAINASLGSQGIDPNYLTKFRAQSYCPELTTSPVITGLINESPVWPLAESAIGVGKIRPVKGGQIALRFPSMEQPGEPHAHIDGMYTPTNGVPKGTIANFTALVGVLLSDLPQPYSGNLAVWPGTHRSFETYFRERGPQSLLEGMPQVEMPEPVQITGNGSPNIRYAIYFRLSHVDHDNLHWECMTDIWREWEGMQDLVQAGAGSR